MFLCIGSACGGLLYLGLYPSLYYMGDFFFLIVLWGAGVLAFVFRWYVRGFVLFLHRLPDRPLIDLRRWILLGCLLLLTTTLILTRVQLRIGFLTAWPGLHQLAAGVNPNRGLVLPADQRCGLYVISSTNTRRCNIPGGIIFMLANDRESGIIYSPNGIDGLAYNSGNKGRLFGDWYWMTED